MMEEAPLSVLEQIEEIERKRRRAEIKWRRMKLRAAQ